MTESAYNRRMTPREQDDGVLPILILTSLCLLVLVGVLTVVYDALS